MRIVSVLQQCRQQAGGGACQHRIRRIIEFGGFGVHDHDPAAGTGLGSVYARVVAEAVPIWSRSPLRQVAREFFIGTAIHLPLSDDGVTVNKILGATVFSSFRT